MASWRGNRDVYAMISKTKSIPSRAGTSDFAARNFSKARVLAERLGICPRTIFRWADAGKITRHKINARVVLFDESEITSLLAGSRIATAGRSKA